MIDVKVPLFNCLMMKKTKTQNVMNKLNYNSKKRNSKQNTFVQEKIKHERKKTLLIQNILFMVKKETQS